jgi:diazepam-binding inhibitor (GABA receptor modulating acyl-CoA-binding protein)
MVSDSEAAALCGQYCAPGMARGIIDSSYPSFTDKELSMSAFEQAQKDVNTLSQKPDTADLLELYKYYKQASVGDVTGERPGMMNIGGRFKYDAWAAIKGMSKADAETAYVAKVQALLKADGK